MERKGWPLEPRYSLWQGIPEVYRGRRPAGLWGDGDRTFFEHFVDSFDAVLAPIHSTVEDLDLYVDPELCPPDFLPWLADWFGVTLNQRWSLERRREFVRQAAAVYRARGTLGGLRRAIELFLGVEAQVEDTGGVQWSRQPRQPIRPERPGVTVTVPDRTDAGVVDLELVNDIAESFVPPFVTVEVRRATSATNT